MYSYDSMKRKRGNRVSQMIDSPILIMDYFDLTDVFAALFVILVFGIVASTWKFMFALLVLVLGVGPIVKRRNNKGIFLHIPYKKFGMSLPGLINPNGSRRYSD